MCQALSYIHRFNPHNPMEQALLLSPLLGEGRAEGTKEQRS